jgi:LPXTG-site transpeptidase (sortase) family protein
MKYDYKEGIQRKRSRKWVYVPFLGLFAGIYMLVNVMSPTILDVMEPADATAKKLVVQQPELAEDRVYIPKINVSVPLVQIDGNEKKALERGAIQRVPENGNPVEGGNFVVAAHRFHLGLTPNMTKARSPFYHINKLSGGDDIYVDYRGTRYAYRIEERKTVAATAVEVEERTDTPILTLYSCDLSGPKNGREVVIAKPIGKIVWANGKPRLQAIDS